MIFSDHHTYERAPGSNSPVVDAAPATQFKAGDIVHLKSGSARLTVARAGRESSVCCWIEYNTQRYNEHTIPNEALELHTHNSRDRR